MKKKLLKDSNRLLFSIPVQEETIESLMAQRLPFYLQADIIVDTDGKTPGQVAQEIIKKLKL